MKDDVEIPSEIPSKRRSLEQALDLWIAVWLASDKITPSERRRLEEEKARRRAKQPDRRVGLLVGYEGVTPAQQYKLATIIEDLDPTEFHYTRIAGALHRICKSRGKPVMIHSDQRSVVRSSQILLAAPRSSALDSVVGEAVRYAKHRKLVVRIVLPTGEEA